MSMEAVRLGTTLLVMVAEHMHVSLLLLGKVPSRLEFIESDAKRTH